MSVLASLLKQENIYETSDFEEYIKKLPVETPFQYIHDGNLQEFFETVDTDKNCVLVDELMLKNTIIHVKHLEIKVKTSLRFVNCIVVDKLRITGLRGFELSSILLDNCIFMKELDLMNLKHESCNLSVYHTNSRALNILNARVDQMVIHGCRIFLFAAHDISGRHLEVENNEIRHFEIEDYQFESVQFDHTQIKIKHFSNRIKSKFDSFELKAYHDLDLDMNLFEFKSYGSIPIYKEEAQYKTTFSTLTFLKEHTEIAQDKNHLNSILFLESFLTQKSFSRKLFIGITGGFLQPSRFLIIGLVAYITYSLLYLLFGFSVADAFYFSGITFTTIGYGDIIPEGFARVIAVSEGVVGVIFTSAFLVSLVKKYVD